MTNFPLSGTVTFLFTDIESSTKLLHRLGENYEKVLSEHNSILRSVIKKFGGKEQDNSGDGFFISFNKAKAAVEAAIEIQKRLESHKWTGEVQVNVRMGIHTGEPNVSESGYIGIDVHLASRIGAAGHGKQILISETTKTLIENDLPEEISIKDLGKFCLKDFDKPETIYQIEIKGFQNEFPQLKTPAFKKSNIPFHLANLIGREKELEDVRKILLSGDKRIVTLTGPGGTGKTSLAYKISESLLGDFKDGVYVVLLASISDATLVSSAIARALGINETPSTPVMECLKDFLSSKKMLLVLDNYEQIVSSANILSELLDYCPDIKILVTSRIVLQIKNETEYFVPPLALPGSNYGKSISSLSQYPAVKLFIERAKAVKHDFTITEENAQAIAEICVRLDGLPLAIELASARIKLFTPQMILSRLGSKFDILKSKSRSLPERHQTLKQAISWSYDLLPDEEKKIFRWMSVFSGGSVIESIESIFGSMEKLEIDIHDGVEALINKSLLRRSDEDDADAEPRFYMLETIREFSMECLEDDEKLILMKHYVNYFLKLAEDAEPNLSKKGMEYWFNKLDYERHNFRNSLQWSFEQKDSSSALKLVGALLRYKIVRGNLVEGLNDILKAIKMPQENTITLYRAKALNAAGTIVHEISDYKSSLKLLEESLEIYKKLEDESGIASVLNNIAWVNIHLGNIYTAIKLSEEALELNTRLNNDLGVAVAKNNFAWLAFRQGDFEKAIVFNGESEKMRIKPGDSRGVAFAQVNTAWCEIMTGKFDEAAALIDKALLIIEELKDRQLSAWACNIKANLHHSMGNYDTAEDYLNNSIIVMKEIGNKWVIFQEMSWLGHIKMDKGDLVKAKKLIGESVELFRQNGSKWGTASSLVLLGQLYIKENNPVRAKELYSESLLLNIETGNKHLLMQCFDGMAEIAVLENDPEKAAILYGVSDEIKKITKYCCTKCESERRDKNLKLLNEKLQQETVTELFNEGRGMNVEEAVRLVIT